MMVVEIEEYGSNWLVFFDVSIPPFHVSANICGREVYTLQMPVLKDRTCNKQQ